MNRRDPALLLVALLAGCSPAAHVTASPENVITIATELPLTDRFTESGALLDAAVRLAVANAGPAGGYRLQVRSFDEALAGTADGAKATQNIQRMLAEPDVLAVVGPMTAPAATATIAVAAPGHLAMVMPSVTYDCLTLTIPGCPSPARFRRWGPQNYVRLAAPDRETGKAIAELARRVGIDRAVILLDDDPASGIGFARGFQEGFAAAGGQIVLMERYAASANDLTPLLNRIAASRAEAVFVAPGAPATACRLRAEMRGILPDSTYFLSTGVVTSTACLQDAGATDDDHMIAAIGVPAPDPRDPRTASFLRSVPAGSAYAATAYDSALVAVEGIRRAVAADQGRIPTRAQVSAALFNGPGVKGITGTWSFDADGDASRPGVTFYRPQGGRWRLWTPSS